MINYHQRGFGSRLSITTLKALWNENKGLFLLTCKVYKTFFHYLSFFILRKLMRIWWIQYLYGNNAVRRIIINFSAEQQQEALSKQYRSETPYTGPISITNTCLKLLGTHRYPTAEWTHKYWLTQSRGLIVHCNKH